MINFDDKQSKRTDWVSLFIDKNTAVCFDFFGFKYIPIKVLRKIKNKSITHNVVRIQNDHCIMRLFYCITFIEYMIAGKTLSDYT